MASLFEIWLEVLPLFLTLVRLQNIVGVFRTIGFDVRSGDTYINDTISPSGLKATDQHISSIFAFVLVKIMVDLRTGLFRSCHLNCSATIMDYCLCSCKDCV
jgi:hypothetical protein